MASGRRSSSVALDDDRQPDPALERGGVRPERVDEAVLLEVARPQLEDQRPHLGEGLALEVAQLGELVRRARRIAVEQQLHGPRHEGHREQRLGDRVVELAGEVGPLLARGELAGLAPQVALEALALGDVAGRAVDPDEDAVDGHADPADLDGDVVAVVVAERQPIRCTALGGEPASGRGRRVAAAAGSKTFEKGRPISSAG